MHIDIAMISKPSFTPKFVFASVYCFVCFENDYHRTMSVLCGCAVHVHLKKLNNL